MIKNNLLKSEIIILFLFLFCTFSLMSCRRNPADQFRKKGGLRVWVKPDERIHVDNELRDKTIKIINDRIMFYGITPHIQWSDTDNYLIVEIPGENETEHIRQLLLAQANLEFRETYSLEELYPVLYEIDSELANILQSIESECDDDTGDLMEELPDSINGESEYPIMENENPGYHPLLSVLMVDSNNMKSSVIGYAYQKDKELIMEYLNKPQIKKILPVNISFQWSAKPIKSMDAYELYALKTENQYGNAALSGDMVRSARRTSDEWNRDVIDLELNAEASKSWEQLTAQNIKRSLAIMIDGKIYSVPMVQNKIAGGRFRISGNFSREEVNYYANLLNSGMLVYPIEIIKEEIVIP